MKVVEVLSVAPILETGHLPTQTSLSLTFFDILWLRLPPVQRIFFYEFPHPTSLFFDTLLPKLKHSLSLALGHFLPLAGHLTWPLHSTLPLVIYNAGDTLSLIVAESEADFNHLAGTDLAEAKEVHHLLPHLTTSYEQANVLALQVTLFPNSGFSIGITSHHAVLDGKSSTSFIKSWAFLCRESTSSLPPELSPLLEREVVKDPNELGASYASDWLNHGGPDNRSLKAWDMQVPEDATRGLFQLSRSHIEKLKQFVVSKQKGNNASLHLSTFVLSVAYAVVCRVKAEEEAKSGRVVLGVNVDCRRWLEPPIPPTYFGNCVGGRITSVETRDLLGEEGVIVAVKALSEILESVKKDGILNGAEQWTSWVLDVLGADDKNIGLAGSPRFGVYGNDFGWGRPKKVEMVSIDRTGAFSLSDSRNGDGIEIGFVSKKKTIEAFASLFAKAL